jgi:hypothetical protein
VEARRSFIILGCVDHGWSDDGVIGEVWFDLAVEVDNPNVEIGIFLFGEVLGAPEDGQNSQNEDA